MLPLFTSKSSMSMKKKPIESEYGEYSLISKGSSLSVLTIKEVLSVDLQNLARVFEFFAGKYLILSAKLIWKS